MREKDCKATAESRFVGGGEMGALLRDSFGDALRSHDWSQTSLGSVETWSDELKTAVQIVLTELDWAQSTKKAALNSDPLPNATEVALRQSEAKYRTLFEAINQGFCVCELIWDEMGNPQDHRILEINSAFERLTGLKDVAGKVGSELIPNLEPFWLETYAGVVRTGESARFESHIQGVDGWFDVYVAAIDAPESDQFAVVFQNITERKRTEEILQRTASLDAFRVALADALRSPTDPIEIQAIANRVLGEYLGANRVAYFEVRGADYVVEQDYVNGSEPIAGHYPIDSFDPRQLAAFRQGRTATSSDVPADPHLSPEQRSAFGAIQIGAYIGVPLIKQGEFVAGLAIHTIEPRVWTPNDIAVAEEVAERTWAAVERARAEEALRQSETRFRRIFECNMVPIAIWTMTGGITQANDALLDMIGYTRQELETGQINWQALTPPEYRSLDEIALNEIATKGVSVPYEKVYVRKDGRRIPILIGAASFLDDDNSGIFFAIDLSDRKQAKAALQESEKRYRTLFESIDQGFCLLEVLFDANDKAYDYRYLEINEAFEEQSGLTNAVGKTIRELVPDLEPQWGECYDQVVKLREAVRFEADVPSMNRVFDIYAVPSGAPGQNLVSVLFTDITDRKQAEAIIATDLENTRLLRDLSARLINEDNIQVLYDEIMATAIALMKADAGTVQILDKATQDLLLLATQGFDRTMTDHFYRVNARSNTSCGIALTRGTRTFIDFDVPECDDPDGSLQMHVNAGYLSAQSTPLISRSGKAIGMVSTHWCRQHRPSEQELRFLDLLARQAADLIERRQTEAALRDSEELKQSILDSSKDCIKVLTLNGEIVYVNTGGLRLLEIDDPTLVLNARWLAFWQGEDRENAKTAIAAARAGNTGQFQGYRLTHQGTPKWWDILITPVRDSAGQVTQLLVVSRDITKQKQAETERERLLAQEQAAREQAETANRVKDEFLAVLSHELRSPLNPILGWTRLLQNGNLAPARQMDALATIERNAKLQSQLIEDLLDISRILQGKLTLTATPVSLAFVIAAAVETVSLAAAAKNIQITLDLDPDVALVSGDAARLQQVVWNLLTNAVKFTDKGGQVTVQLRRVSAAGSLGNTMAQIEVIDTGKGISPQFLPYVFESFRQEDGSTTRKFGGLGLGLAIVRQIVELHGGTVKAESQGEQQGATFSVRLPALQQATPSLSEQNQLQSGAETRLDNVQILLVEDDTDTREYQAFLLEQHGATVTAVASGVEALQALDQWLPDVIVSDIGMAEMDGYSLMQQIRSCPPAQGGAVPAIALTAYAAEIDQEKALQAGFQTHLTKPLEPERFVSEIITLLKPKRV